MSAPAPQLTLLSIDAEGDLRWIGTVRTWPEAQALADSLTSVDPDLRILVTETRWLTAAPTIRIEDSPHHG